MRQEFHISITPIGREKYLVRTAQIAPGVPSAAEIVTLPVNHWLTQATQLLNDCNHSTTNLVVLGQQLYNALFQGSLRSSWLAAQAIAQQQQEILQLCLEIKDATLSSLPWEILHTENGYPLASDPLITLTRYQSELLDLDFELDEESWEDIDDDTDDYELTKREDAAVVASLLQHLNNEVPTADLPPTAQTKAEKTNQSFNNFKQSLRLRLTLLTPHCTAGALTHHPQVKAWMQHTKNNFDQICILSGTMAAIALILLSQEWQNRGLVSQNFWQPVAQFALLKLTEVNFKTASNSDITATAIQSFRNGDLNAGSLAVEELLNRGALPSAKTALATISPQQAKVGAMNYLHGRLAWQSVRIGDQSYNLAHTYYYWKVAVKLQPSFVQYHNALGFAYYEAGKLNLASKAWFEALYLYETQQAAKANSSTKSTPMTSVSQQEALNAYAGLALVLQKAAINQPQEQQEKLLSEAIQLQQKVLTEDPVNFQPQKLSRNWLWTATTIQDWRSLLQKQQ